MQSGRARVRFTIAGIGISSVIRFVIVVSAAFLSACISPPTPDTKVIVGATLISSSQPPLDHAVIIVKDDKIAAVGTQQMLPIPPGSSKVEAYGKFVTAEEGGGELRAGSKANLVIFPKPRRSIPP